MVDVNKKQLLRLRFINELYDQVDGEPDNYVGSLEVGKAIGLSEFREVESIMHYLADEGLLEIQGFGDDNGPPIGLTHQGIVEIEQARTNPKQKTEHFPPMVNIIHVQNMHGSQIQQGTVNSSQSQTNNTTNVQNVVRDLVRNIEGSSQATEEQKELARTYGEVIVSQTQVPAESRNSELVKKTWEKLNNISVALSLIDFASKAAPVVSAFFGF